MTKRGKRELTPERKHELYEASVQDAPDQVSLFERIYKEVSGKAPLHLCEDFSGTFMISTEWIQRGEKRTATAIDNCAEPLTYGRKVHRSRLTPDQKKRLFVKRDDVLHKPERNFDVIAACNFSFFVFHERKVLLEYFKRSRRALKRDGVFILEMAGGQGFIETPYSEERVVEHETGPKKGKPWFYYFWNHKSFEPLTRNGVYSITFKVPGEGTYNDAFVYDWRVYTIPEVRDCMQEAGFREVRIYWERKNSKGEDSYEWVQKTDGDDYTWICYAVGIK